MMKRLINPTLLLIALLLFKFDGISQLNVVEGRFNLWIENTEINTPNDLLKHSEFQDFKIKYPNLVISKRFPEFKAEKEKYNKQGIRFADLSGMYRLDINASVSWQDVVNDLLKTGLFKSVEPHVIQELLFIPNDDSLALQYALHRINAFAAWNVAQGDTNMVIGISDTGLDKNHPDLLGNLKRNMADPINGVDDDNDGFIDNYLGWDLGENDNDVSPNGSWHGTFVAGISSAMVNNSVGIAGVGFKCKFLPIKITNSNGQLTEGYESIVYAADRGCKIINCSWGSFFYSPINQEIIKYATINKDALVFAGVGNQGNNRLFYPAYYEYVMGIGSTGPNDEKSYFSNFNYLVDFMAPGEQIISTWIGDTYLVSNGTSLSTPMAAACAAIVRSSFPQLNALQAGERLRVSCDPVHNLAENEQWKYQMGSGRLNMFNALTQNGKPSVVLNEIEIKDGKQNLFLPGDTARISGILTNYLFPAQNVSINIQSLYNSIQVLTPTLSIGAMQTMQSNNIEYNSIRLKLLENHTLNDTAVIRLEIIADGNIQYQYVTFRINADFEHLAENNIKTSISSGGLLGYVGERRQQGFGFLYKNVFQLLFEGGLMLASDNQTVFDVIRSESMQSNQDFQVFNRMKEINVPQINAKVLEGLFVTQPSANTPLKFDIRLQAFAFRSPLDSNYVLLNYFIQNTSPFPADMVNVGIFSDWDIGNYSRNKAIYLNENRSITAFSNDNGFPMSSTTLLSNQTAIPHAFEISNSTQGININDGFSDFEKWVAMTNPLLQAGDNNNGADIATLLSASVGPLQPYETVNVCFAWSAGMNQSELNQAIQQAQINYQSIVLPLVIQQTQNFNQQIHFYPNPAQNELTIRGLTENGIIEIRDMQGRLVSHFKTISGQVSFDISNLSDGIYVLNFSSLNTMFSKKLVIKK